MLTLAFAWIHDQTGDDQISDPIGSCLSYHGQPASDELARMFRTEAPAPGRCNKHLSFCERLPELLEMQLEAHLQYTVDRGLLDPLSHEHHRDELPG